MLYLALRGSVYWEHMMVVGIAACALTVPFLFGRLVKLAVSLAPSSHTLDAIELSDSAVDLAFLAEAVALVAYMVLLK
jgi:hypothetical protein